MLDWPLLVFVFGAGLAAFVNPCGFAVLLAYVTNFFTQKTKSASFFKRLLYGLFAGFFATLGFISLFTLAGLSIGFVSASIAGAIPFVNLALGVVLLGYAYFLHKGGRLGIHLHMRVKHLEGPWSFYLFGVVYALASFGCTLPLFMAAVVATLASGGIVPGVQTFLAYSLGMGLAMTVVSVALATSQTWLAGMVRGLEPKMQRLNVEVLALVGAYLIIRNVLILANIPLPVLFHISL